MAVLPRDERRVSNYVARARKSPRLNEMFASFSRISNGQEGSPHTPVEIDPGLLGYDRRALSYAAVRQRYASPFNAHFVASLPYALEEQCRLGSALLDYGQRLGHPFSVYTLGDGAGVTARAIATASRGQIRTLNCSPNPENHEEFLRDQPSGAHFFPGPFFELSAERRSEIAEGLFRSGFDVVIEDTTFQMYGPERIEPIALVTSHLKSDGLFLLIEKLAQPDPEEFVRREHQKDGEFKSRYFSPEEVARKRNTIVSRMDSQLVTLEELTNAVALFFRYAVAIWNSGNFYTVAASNCESRLHQLTESMLPPAVPHQFLYEQLPLALAPPGRGTCSPYRFRDAER